MQAGGNPGRKKGKRVEELTLPGEPPIELTLKPSARARRLSLKVSRLDGRVTLTLPKGASRRQAIAFLREHEPWLRRNLAAAPAPIRPQPGGHVLFEGREHALVIGPVRAPLIADGTITLPERTPQQTPARLAALFRQAARDRLVEASERHARTLGADFTAISLRDTRSRWGSCSREGRLMYSWRLVMAPPEVLDYVAAHEVAHLRRMDHSPAFWALVETLYPGHRSARDWLRRNGALLHRYRFGD